MVNLYVRCHCASLLEHTFYEAFRAGIRLCLKHENVSCKWTVVDPHCTRSAVDIRTNKPCIQADKLVQSEGYSWNLVIVNQNGIVSEMQPRAVVLCGKSMASEA